MNFEFYELLNIKFCRGDSIFNLFILYEKKIIYFIFFFYFKFCDWMFIII